MTFYTELLFGVAKVASRMMAVDAHETCASFVHPAPSAYNFRPVLLNRCHQRHRLLRGARVKYYRRIFSCSSVSDTAAVVEKQLKATETPRRNVLKFYNTMSRKKEPFIPIDEGIVKFYSCGPTIYDFAHIGNFRAFLTYDVIKRWLLYCGFKVNHVMNLTDIDDKIIDRAKKLNCSMSELTDKFADAFFKDMDLLNIIPAQHYPRATQHIKDIEDTIESLEEKGFAYKQDGSTYFSVGAFSKYGRLAELDKRQEDTPNEEGHSKQDHRDFALWKSWKREDGDVFWKSRLGNGRPGWHIECSCMAMKFLGPELDIHGGGVDLVFPHHENEIAQSEAYTGRTFARFWIHNGFVNINNEKMSKSLGNFRTLRDIVKTADDARAFRYMVVTSQYRSALAFTSESLKSAKSAVKRIDALRKKLQTPTGIGGEVQMHEAVSQATDNFRDALSDDLNTPRAAAALFSVVKSAERLIKSDCFDQNAAKLTLEFLDDVDKVFGINYKPDLKKLLGLDTESVSSETEATIPTEIQALLKQRNTARKSKDFILADSLRESIGKAGYAIVDAPGGSYLKKIER